MTIVQLNKSLRTIKSLDMDVYNRIYFLALVETRSINGTDGYVFRSKRLDCLRFCELKSYLDNPEYILVRIEK